MQIKNICLGLTLITFLAGCSNRNEESDPLVRDVLAENLDSTVKPGSDFFLYANGGWIKKNPIPADQSSWGIGHLVIEENLKRLRDISEKAAATNAAKGSAEQKIGDFWATAMDSAAIEKAGLRPIQSMLDKVDAISDTRSLVNTVAELKKAGSLPLLGRLIHQDDKNSGMMAYKWYRAVLACPEGKFNSRMKLPDQFPGWKF